MTDEKRNARLRASRAAQRLRRIGHAATVAKVWARIVARREASKAAEKKRLSANKKAGLP